jgi:hypothetical protein
MQDRAPALDNGPASNDGAREMIKIAITLLAIVAALVGAKQSNALERANLLSSCSAVAAPRGDDGAWQVCSAGRLDGRPDLSRKSCKPRGFAGELEYWSCPAGIGAGYKTE